MRKSTRSGHVRLGIWMWSKVASTLSVGGASTAFAWAMYRPLGSLSATPLATDNDVWIYLTYVRNLLSGNVNATARLGAPLGMNLDAFPVGNELTHFVLYRLVGLFTDNPITVMNVSYLLGFGLVAMAAELVARELGIRRSLAVVFAVLFTFLPYHFGQGERHVVLAAYYSVPLGILLAVWTFRGTLPIPRVAVERGRWESGDTRRLLVAVVCATIGSTSDPYYTLFNLVLIASAALVAQLRRRDLRTLLSGAIVCSLMALLFVATLLPAILWQRAHPEQLDASTRPIGDLERYGLHISQLIAPDPQHRIAPLASIGTKVRDVPTPGEVGSYLGILALIGLAVALIRFLRSGLRSADADDLRSSCGALALVAIAWGTVGGLGLLSGLAFTQIRNWSRLSVYLAGFGLLALAAEVHARLGSARRPLGSRRASLIGLAMVIGLFDQVPANAVPDTSALARQLDATRSLVHDLEASLPRNAMVFQYPVMPFPGFGSQYQLDTQYPLVPYLVDAGKLRWSFGGVRGTPAATWQANWAQESPAPMLVGLALAGYDAILVDDRGELDHAAGLMQAAERLVGPAHHRTADGTQRWFDLRRLRAELTKGTTPAQRQRARNLLLHSAFALIRNAQPPSSPPSPGLPQWFEQTSAIELRNPLSRPRQVVLHLVLSADATSTLHLSGDGLDRTIPLTTTPRAHDLTIIIPAGASRIAVTSDAPVMYAAPQLRAQSVLSGTVRVDRLLVTDPEVTAMVGST
jgi:phosphoglycerol transferase